MGIRDKLTGFGRVAATAAADALLDWADTGSFQKAAAKGEDSAPGDKRNDPGDEGGENAPGGAEEESSASDPVPEQKASQDPKSLFHDPFAIIEQLGFKEKPTAVTYNTLKMIMWRMPIIQAIVQTRSNQVASFCRPSHNRYDLGFRVKLREQEKEPTGADKKWAAQMETLLLRTGVTDNPRGRDGMAKLLRKLTWDSMVYDQMCMEIVPNRKGQPAEWYAVDASTMRLADTARAYMNEDLASEVRYVQIYDSMIVSEYTQEELHFGVRNPRTDIRLHGYGVSELEILIQVITSFLNTWDYNSKFFTQGSAAKGLLNFKGAINETQLKAFRRHWYQMLSGVENAWRTPITNAEDVQWLSMQSSNRDMEYSAWMDFLIKIACSCYAMDPVEVNFKYGNAGQKGAMQEQSNREKISESKERGLRPLLDHLSDAMNRSILWPINENFEFTFVGLDSHTRDEAADLQKKQVSAYRTVDEIRAEEDLPPLPDGKGEVILDPTWLQFQSQKDAAAQQAQMAAQGGGFGQPGEEQPADEQLQQYGQQYGQQDEEPDFDAMLREGSPNEPPKAQAQAQQAPPQPPQKPAQPAPPQFQKSERDGNRVRIDVQL